MTAHQAILAICAILGAGFVCQWLAWRIKVPAILFLLVTGIMAGPVFGVLDPDALLGDLLMPVVSVAVAVILFEGSLTLKISELRGNGAVVRNLVTLGVVVTWLASAFSAHLILGWDFYLAALFGAIVTVSGPTVVMPLLRTVRPSATVASVLRWEAILIDPLGAILGLLVFDFIVAAQLQEGLVQALVTVLVMAVTGTALGAAGGYLFGLAVRKRTIPDFLRDYAGLAAALTVFAAAEAVRGESGLLAVTVMGIWLANMRHVDIDDIVNFKESLTLMLVTGLFMLLAARLDVESLRAVGLGTIGLLAILQIVAGPVRALLCSVGSPLRLRERLFIGWVFPRGIVAAAISSLFALRLESSGIADSTSLVPVVFTVIIGTVVVQSLTAGPISRWLDVAEPPPTGVLVVGANRIGLNIAGALKDAGLPVLVADSHWDSIRKARMLGLRTYYGSAVSAYADANLSLTGLGNLLTVSRRPGYNELACARFARDFGRNNVYTIGNHRKGEHEKHLISGQGTGRMLYGGEQTLDDLLALLIKGMEIRVTELTKAFTWEDYGRSNPDHLPLFAVDEDGILQFPVADKVFEPEPGWKVGAFVPKDDNGDE